jgi:hypothetical protein
MLEDQIVESLQISFSITFQNNQVNYANLPTLHQKCHFVTSPISGEATKMT